VCGGEGGGAGGRLARSSPSLARATAPHLGLSGSAISTPAAEAQAGSDATSRNTRQPRVGMMAQPMMALYSEPTIQCAASSTM
jgi:hypothetical protein